MIWTALVPVKRGAERKSRLAPLLDSAVRRSLSDRMLRHVLRVLSESPRVGRTIVLSPALPPDWEGEWCRDEGRGLNDELSAFRGTFGDHPLLVIHGDLPLLAASDLAALLDLAERDGAALAPDRHGLGSNALAIADGRAIEFCFGVGSRTLHERQGTGIRVIAREGLAADVDTPEDLAFARSRGLKA